MSWAETASSRDPGSRRTQGLRKTNWEDCHLGNPQEASVLLPSRPKGRDEMIHFLKAPTLTTAGGLLGDCAQPF